MPLTTPQYIVLDLDAADRVAATRFLAQRLTDDGRIADLDGFLDDVQRREAQMATGLPGGVAIPHSRSRHVREPALAFGRSAAGIDWGAQDGPARLVFLIAVPEGGGTDHLAVLAKLARRLTKQSFRDDLLSLNSEQAVSDLLTDELDRA